MSINNEDTFENNNEVEEEVSPASLNDFDPSKENILDYLKNKLKKDEEETNEILDEDNVDEYSGEFSDVEFKEEQQKEKINPELIINDGKLDFDIDTEINFTPGKDIHTHFKVEPESIDAFSGIFKELFNKSFSQVIYHKSISDQIKQLGLSINVESSFSLWESYLEKLTDIKMLSWLCDLVDLKEDGIKSAIINQEINKKFGYIPTKTSKPNNDSVTLDDVYRQLTRISSKEKKNRD